MATTDPIADLLTRIRNAHLAKHDRLDVPASKIKLEICRLLRDEGFIRNYREVEAEPAKLVRIFLRYTPEGEPAIRHLKRISMPGRRVYRQADEIRPVLNGLWAPLSFYSRRPKLPGTRAYVRDQMWSHQVIREHWGGRGDPLEILKELRRANDGMGQSRSPHEVLLNHFRTEIVVLDETIGTDD